MRLAPFRFRVVPRKVLMGHISGVFAPVFCDRVGSVGGTGKSRDSRKTVPDQYSPYLGFRPSSSRTPLILCLLSLISCPTRFFPW